MKSKFLAHLRSAWCISSLLSVALATPPVVKTVPWVASNPLVPHTTFAGEQVTLKGTCDQQGSNLTWTWDFGDGTVATGTVTNQYVIEAKHLYVGPVNTTFSARLTVVNTTTGETGNKAYYVRMADKTLNTEVNVAIDEGLWFLHKVQERPGDQGYWLNGNSFGFQASLGYYGVSAANVNAFEVNGHLESGPADDPYTETVRRGLKALFTWLAPVNVPLQNPGSRNPDSNGNGIGLVINQSNPYYQGGMFMDAIVASGTPNAITTTGGTSVLGRTYKDVVQDMVDAYAWAQYDGTSGGYLLGGWRYSANEFPDNSACQWAAIGMLAAERNWGCIIPLWVREWNIPWLRFSQATSGTLAGSFGYTSTSGVWGPYATTASGMVQMVFDDIGRGTGGTPSWESAETFMRDRFTNSSGGPTNALKDYYYAMFSFVKAMLLHRSAGTVGYDPIVFLHSQTTGVPDVDWYGAEVSKGDITDGIARTLVNDQSSVGYWYNHDYDSNQYRFETAWAIMMLHQTLFESGVPVSVPKAVPNPAIAGQTILLDGGDSYHQDPARTIVKWEWDVNASGTFVDAGPTVLTSFSSVGNYPVKLRVTDDASPTPKTAVATVTVLVSTPPLAPTADANGPYHFCAALSKWFLDGRASKNPDEGLHELGDFPPDTIKEYAWDLDGNNDFKDAFGPTPDVKQFFMDRNMGVGSYLIQLRVTDNTAASYPDSGMGDQVSTASGVVNVDETCACVTLAATPVVKGVLLSWSLLSTASSYNVYRSEVAGGPYTWIGNATLGSYEDHVPGPLNQTYYYIVRPAALNGDELCQSDEVSAEPLHPAPVAICVLNPIANAPYYFKVDATSQSFGHMQLLLWVGDSADSSFAVGPLPAASTIYLRTHYKVQSVRDGSGSIAKYITVKGDALVWAVDPLGQKSAVVVVH